MNRLQIIHLFEADYNLFLKIFWAHRLVDQGEKHKQFGKAQQGSRSGRQANDAALLKRLTYNLTRQQRSNLGTFDNDAKSCYNRIINGLAMLAAKWLGMPSSPIATHLGVLASMKYVIKTSFGVSETFIQSLPTAFLFGTGQGSGASPAIWLTLSTIMLDTLRDLTPHGMTYQSPDRTRMVTHHSDAFVDDTQNGLTDTHASHPWSLNTLIRKLRKMAQTWEKILTCSGGALELSKCSYYLLYWKWENGLPQLTPINEFPPDNVYNSTEVGNLILISLATLQMEAGTAAPLLTDPTINLSYLPQCWLSSIQEFMRINQLQLQMASSWNFPIPRGGDQFLMDVFRCSKAFSAQDLVNLNAVCIFLQVATVSDITAADGKSIVNLALLAQRNPT